MNNIQFSLVCLCAKVVVAMPGFHMDSEIRSCSSNEMFGTFELRQWGLSDVRRKLLLLFLSSFLQYLLIRIASSRSMYWIEYINYKVIWKKKKHIIMSCKQFVVKVVDLATWGLINIVHVNAVIVSLKANLSLNISGNFTRHSLWVTSALLVLRKLTCFCV